MDYEKAFLIKATDYFPGNVVSGCSASVQTRWREMGSNLCDSKELEYSSQTRWIADLREVLSA
jgi:hypothetical protein